MQSGETTNHWVSRCRQTAPYLVLFIVAFGLRLVYLLEIKQSPFFASLMVDARAYDLWGQRIADGDWLGSEIFYQAPLYPYFMGFIYALFGHDLFCVRFVQVILGSMSCVFLALAGRSFFSVRPGLLAGFLLALYPPAIFFDGLIQKSVLDLFFTTLLLLLLGRNLHRDSVGGWWWTGLVLGCFVLTRENALALVIVIAGWGWLGFSRVPRLRRLVWLALFILGLATVLMPVGLRNKIVGGEFLLTTSQFGPNFYIGNNANANGRYMPLRWDRGTTEYERQDATELAEAARGSKLSPGEVSQYWTGKSLEFIREKPGQWLALTARKWFYVWNATELADAEDIDTYCEYSHLLNMLNYLLNFGILCPVAVLGIVATWNDRRRLWLLYAFLLVIAASVTMFFVFGRYRYPLVPVLMLFAGIGVLKAIEMVRRSQWKRLAIGAGCVVACAVFVNWPILPANQQRANAHFNLGQTLGREGDIDASLLHYHKAIELDPNHVKAHFNLGYTLASQGKVEEVVTRYNDALRIKPDFVEAHNNLALALAAQGKWQEAIAHYREALRLNPGHIKAHYNLAVALASLGKVTEAMDQYAEALQLNPDYVEARLNRGILLMAQGKTDEAIAEYSRALQSQPDYLKAHFNLGVALVAKDERAEAARHFQMALQLAQSTGQTNLIATIQNQMKQLQVDPSVPAR